MYAAQTPSDDRGLPQMCERDVSVGHQDLGRVATTDRQGRCTMTREVECDHRSGPLAGGGGNDVWRSLAESV